MAPRTTRIPTLPFRHFLTYAEMTAFLEQLVAARPRLATLDSLGRSREGREVWCLTITDPKTGAASDKPAYLIHGNIHAAELSGTHAARCCKNTFDEARRECTHAQNEFRAL